MKQEKRACTEPPFLSQTALVRSAGNKSQNLWHISVIFYKCIWIHRSPNLACKFRSFRPTANYFYNLESSTEKNRFLNELYSSRRSEGSGADLLFAHWERNACVTRTGADMTRETGEEIFLRRSPLTPDQYYRETWLNYSMVFYMQIGHLMRPSTSTDKQLRLD